VIRQWAGFVILALWGLLAGTVAWAFPGDDFDAEEPAIWSYNTQNFPSNSGSLAITGGNLVVTVKNYDSGKGNAKAYAEHTLADPTSPWEGYVRAKFSSTAVSTGNVSLGVRFLTSQAGEAYVRLRNQDGCRLYYNQGASEAAGNALYPNVWYEYRFVFDGSELRASYREQGSAEWIGNYLLRTCTPTDYPATLQIGQPWDLNSNTSTDFTTVLMFDAVSFTSFAPADQSVPNDTFSGVTVDDMAWVVVDNDFGSNSTVNIGTDGEGALQIGLYKDAYNTLLAQGFVEWMERLRADSWTLYAQIKYDSNTYNDDGGHLGFTFDIPGQNQAFFRFRNTNGMQVFYSQPGVTGGQVGASLYSNTWYEIRFSYNGTELRADYREFGSAAWQGNYLLFSSPSIKPERLKIGQCDIGNKDPSGNVNATLWVADVADDREYDPALQSLPDEDFTYWPLDPAKWTVIDNDFGSNSTVNVAGDGGGALQISLYKDAYNTMLAQGFVEWTDRLSDIPWTLYAQVKYDSNAYNDDGGYLGFTFDIPGQNQAFFRFRNTNGMQVFYSQPGVTGGQAGASLYSKTWYEIRFTYNGIDLRADYRESGNAIWQGNYLLFSSPSIKPERLKIGQCDIGNKDPSGNVNSTLWVADVVPNIEYSPADQSLPDEGFTYWPLNPTKWTLIDNDFGSDSTVNIGTDGAGSLQISLYKDAYNTLLAQGFVEWTGRLPEDSWTLYAQVKYDSNAYNDDGGYLGFTFEIPGQNQAFFRFRNTNGMQAFYSQPGVTGGQAGASLYSNTWYEIRFIYNGIELRADYRESGSAVWQGNYLLFSSPSIKPERLKIGQCDIGNKDPSGNVNATLWVADVIPNIEYKPADQSLPDEDFTYWPLNPTKWTLIDNDFGSDSTVNIGTDGEGSLQISLYKDAYNTLLAQGFVEWTERLREDSWILYAQVKYDSTTYNDDGGHLGFTFDIPGQNQAFFRFRNTYGMQVFYSQPGVTGGQAGASLYSNTWYEIRFSYNGIDLRADYRESGNAVWQGNYLLFSSPSIKPERFKIGQCEIGNKDPSGNVNSTLWVADVADDREYSPALQSLPDEDFTYWPIDPMKWTVIDNDFGSYSTVNLASDGSGALQISLYKDYNNTLLAQGFVEWAKRLPSGAWGIVSSFSYHSTLTNKLGGYLGYGVLFSNAERSALYIWNGGGGARLAYTDATGIIQQSGPTLAQDTWYDVRILYDTTSLWATTRPTGTETWSDPLILYTPEAAIPERLLIGQLEIATISTSTQTSTLLVDYVHAGTPPPIPTISVTPDSRDFGSVVAGQSADLTFTVVNAGGGTLTGDATVPAGAFSIVAGSAHYSLTSGATHTVTVRFQPSAGQDYSSTVTFTGGGGATRPVNGRGIERLHVEPLQRNVGTQAGTTSFEVTNVGGGTMPWTASVTTGADWLTITSGTSGTDTGTIVCAFQANPGQSRTGTIAVNATGGPTVTVSVIQGACSLPPTVSLGAPEPSLTRGGPVTFSVQYTGSCSPLAGISLAASDVTLNATGCTGSVSVSPSGNPRIVTVSNITGDGTLGISIGPDTAGDQAGNQAPAAGPSATATVDNTPPAIQISAPSPAVSHGEPVVFTVTYTGADTIMLTPDKISLNTGADVAGDLVVEGTAGLTRTIRLQNPTGFGSATLAIAAGTATDNAGNSAAPATSGAFDVDNYVLTLGLTPSGGGTISANPPGGNYTHGTSVSLTPMPNAQYRFDHWEGALTGSAQPGVVVMNANAAVTAVFVPQYALTVTVSPDGGGTVSLNPPTGPYDDGTVVTLTPAAASGYRFHHWQGSVVNNQVTLHADTSVEAVFVRTYPLDVSASPAEGGTFTFDPEPIGGLHDAGTTVLVSAVPANGFRFDRWQGAMTGGANPGSVTMDGPKTATGFFVRQYTLNVSAQPPAGGTVAREPNLAKYDEGTSVALLQTPALWYRFDHWSGDVGANEPPLVMNANKTVQAQFVECTHEILDGMLIDWRTGQKLAGVTVTVSEQNPPGRQIVQGQTDTEGKYSIEVPGQVPLKVQYAIGGYRSMERRNTYAPAHINVALEPLTPVAPTSVTALPGIGKVYVRWAASASQNVAGYEVSRSVTADFASATRVSGANPVAATSFTDTPPDLNGHYYYWVVAVSSDGYRSTPAQSSLVKPQLALYLPEVSQRAGRTIHVPISVSAATDIKPDGLDLDIQYPAGLVALKPDGASPNVSVEKTAITKGMSIVSTTGEMGHVRIQAVNSAVTLTGEGKLFDLVFTLKGNLIGDQCGDVTFAGVNLVVEGASAAVDSTDMGQMCGTGDPVVGGWRQGDITGDWQVNVADTLAALKAAVGRLNIESGSNQFHAADMNGDRDLDSADAVLIMRLAVGLPVNPPDAAKTLADRASKSGTLTATVGTPSGVAGRWVDVPVNVDDAEGIGGIEFSLSYPSQLIFDSVQAGAQTKEFVFQSKADHGTLRVAMSRDNALPIGPAQIAVVRFAIDPGALAGTTLPVTLSDASFKGQYGDSLDWTTLIQRESGGVTVEETPPPAQVTLGVTVAGQGTTSPETGEHVVDAGETTTLTAIPATNWAFDRWVIGGAEYTTARVEVKIDLDTTATAVFVPIFTLGVNPGGGGTVASNPAPGGYAAGTRLELTATPNPKYRFDHWEGVETDPVAHALAGMPDAPVTISAVFTPTRVLAVDADGQGTVDPGKGAHTYDKDSVVNLSAFAAAGWRFDRWEGPVANASQPVTTVTVSEDLAVKAVFIQTHLLTVTASPAAGGTFTYNPPSANGIYDDGTTVVVTAAPANGYRFDRWEGAITGSANPGSVMMDGSKTATAFFVRQYTLTIESSDGGTTDPSPGEYTYDSGATVNVQAIPQTGWHLDFWSGDYIQPGNPARFAITKDSYLRASFRQDSVGGVGALQVNIEPSAAVSLGAQWSFDAGTTWRDSGETVSSLPCGAYTVTFKPLAGWEQPADFTVYVENGETKTCSSVYRLVQTDTGYIRVTIEPAEARAAGAGWMLDDDTTVHSSGETITASVGQHVVHFVAAESTPGGCMAPATNWTTPADIGVNVAPGEISEQSVSYTTGRKTLTANATGGGDFFLLAFASLMLTIGGKHRYWQRNQTATSIGRESQ